MYPPTHLLTISPSLPLRSVQGLVSPILKLFGYGANDKRKMMLLDDCSGVFKPGRVTLLLGPPGAGKSTLLRAMSGQLKDKQLHVSLGCSWGLGLRAWGYFPSE